VKKYYEDVEFSELAEKEVAATDAETDDSLTGESMTVSMTEVRRMIRAIGSGESDISKIPLMLKNAPFLNALSFLEARPSKANLLSFLELAQQDVNTRFKNECELIFKQNNPKIKEILDARDEELAGRAEAE
jgi:UDP-N-acetyl-D-mannosaminuronate dehydrogenase